MSWRGVLLLVIFVALFAVGCAAPNGMTDHARPGAASPAGFWLGLWHGLCAVPALIGILFGMDIGIYDSFNTGNWYNLGFLLGVGAWGGGSSRAAA